MQDMAAKRGAGTGSGRASLVRGLLAGTAVLALAACENGMDLDLRGGLGGFSTTEAARTATLDRPQPDDRGVISYPNYQVAVARRGDTVSSVANRIGVAAPDLASYNGLRVDDGLRQGEVLALPQRVAEPSPATGASGVGRHRLHGRGGDRPGGRPAGRGDHPAPRRQPAARTGAGAPSGRARRDRVYRRPALRCVGQVAGGLERTGQQLHHPRGPVPADPGGRTDGRRCARNNHQPAGRGHADPGTAQFRLSAPGGEDGAGETRRHRNRHRRCCRHRSTSTHPSRECGNWCRTWATCRGGAPSAA